MVGTTSTAFFLQKRELDHGSKFHLIFIAKETQVCTGSTVGHVCGGYFCEVEPHGACGAAVNDFCANYFEIKSIVSPIMGGKLLN